MLMEDRRLKVVEAEVQRNRDQKQIRALTDRWVTFNKMPPWSLESLFLHKSVTLTISILYPDFGVSLDWPHRLQQTQNQLYDSTKELLQLKFDSRAQERSWMAEKDKLLKKMDSCRNCTRKAGPTGAEVGRSWQPGTTPLTESQRVHKEVPKVCLMQGS